MAVASWSAERAPRRFTSWAIRPIISPGGGWHPWPESATVPLLVESLRRHAEIPEIGRARFAGTVSQKNAHWREYRNYVSQGLSNISASIEVGGRSSTLLQYYALLNFAKAELLDGHFSKFVGSRIGHGLSFNPTRARSVAGDFLTVQPGVFPLLYERRTGRALKPGTRLPIARLLANIPEVGSQLQDSAIVEPNIGGVSQIYPLDETICWVGLAVDSRFDASRNKSTTRLILQNFERVSPAANWQNIWAWSKRATSHPVFFESKQALALPQDGSVPTEELNEISWKLRDIISSRSATDETWENILTPYLYSSNNEMPFPAPLARYAVSYFASSLVALPELECS